MVGFHVCERKKTFLSFCCSYWVVKREERVIFLCAHNFVSLVPFYGKSGGEIVKMLGHPKDDGTKLALETGAVV
jgi:hypothetical protein